MMNIVCKIFLLHCAIILVMQNNSVNGTKRGFVYVIHSFGTRWYKIGQTCDPSSRLRNLQTGNQYRLDYKCSYLVNDCVAAEREAKDALRKAFGKCVS